MAFILNPSLDKYNHDLYKDRYDIKSTGIIFDKNKNRFCSIIYNGKKTTYPKVILTANDGNTYHLVLHRLLASIYIENTNPTIYSVVNHIDGNKVNFSLNNLEWVTPSENTKKAFDTGLMNNFLEYRKKSYEDVKDSTLKRKIEIIQDILNGLDNETIGIKYNLHPRYVSCIRIKHKYISVWDRFFKGLEPPQSNKQRTFTMEGVANKYSIEERIKITEELRYSKNVDISKKYGLDQSVLSRVRFGITWEDSYKEHIRRYVVPVPPKPLEIISLPVWLHNTDTDISLSFLLNSILTFKHDYNMRNLLELNNMCAYWCSLKFNLGIYNFSINHDMFNELVKHVRPFIQ